MTGDGRRLVLWDIDHTLIETGGIGRQLYAAAFEAVTGRRIEHVVDPTGRTETAIFAETLERHGIPPTADLHHRYASELSSRYERHAALLRDRGGALPGASAAVAALAARPGVVQTVLTGNLRAVARTKLGVFGLTTHLALDVGAYGEDDHDRAKLVPVAQARAGERYNERFTRENTVVVGDTMSDVRAAQDGGASFVGVASGRDSADDLRSAGAKVVLPDLTDTARVVDAILAG